MTLDESRALTSSTSAISPGRGIRSGHRLKLSLTCRRAWPRDPPQLSRRRQDEKRNRCRGPSARRTHGGRTRADPSPPFSPCSRARAFFSLAGTSRGPDPHQRVRPQQCARCVARGARGPRRSRFSLAGADARAAGGYRGLSEGARGRRCVGLSPVGTARSHVLRPRAETRGAGRRDDGGTSDRAARVRSAARAEPSNRSARS